MTRRHLHTHISTPLSTCTHSGCWILEQRVLQSDEHHEIRSRSPSDRKRPTGIGYFSTAEAPAQNALDSKPKIPLHCPRVSGCHVQPRICLHCKYYMSTPAKSLPLAITHTHTLHTLTQTHTWQLTATRIFKYLFLFIYSINQKYRRSSLRYNTLNFSMKIHYRMCQ